LCVVCGSEVKVSELSDHMYFCLGAPGSSPHEASGTTLPAVIPQASSSGTTLPAMIPREASGMFNIACYV